MYNTTLRSVRLTIFSRGKAMSIIRLYNEFVCSINYSACNAHAPDYIVIWGPSGPTMFFHIVL